MALKSHFTTAGFRNKQGFHTQHMQDGDRLAQRPRISLKHLSETRLVYNSSDSSSSSSSSSTKLLSCKKANSCRNWDNFHRLRSSMEFLFLGEIFSSDNPQEIGLWQPGDTVTPGRWLNTIGWPGNAGSCDHPNQQQLDLKMQGLPFNCPILCVDELRSTRLIGIVPVMPMAPTATMFLTLIAAQLSPLFAAQVIVALVGRESTHLGSSANQTGNPQLLSNSQLDQIFWGPRYLGSLFGIRLGAPCHAMLVGGAGGLATGDVIATTCSWQGGKQLAWLPEAKVRGPGKFLRSALEQLERGRRMHESFGPKS